MTKRRTISTAVLFLLLLLLLTAAGAQAEKTVLMTFAGDCTLGKEEASRRPDDALPAFAEKYGLYVTAGSDYHGTNKLVPLGKTHLGSADAPPEGLTRFLEDVRFA